MTGPCLRGGYCRRIDTEGIKRKSSETPKIHAHTDNLLFIAIASALMVRIRLITALRVGNNVGQGQSYCFDQRWSHFLDIHKSPLTQWRLMRSE